MAANKTTPKTKATGTSASERHGRGTNPTRRAYLEARARFAALEPAMERLHRAYVASERPGEPRLPPNLGVLARAHGVPPKAARDEALVEAWEVERLAHWGRKWYEQYGLGAASEREFVRLAVADRHGRVLEPHRRAFLEALERETWRRIMGPVLEWEARLELARARAAWHAGDGAPWSRSRRAA